MSMSKPVEIVLDEQARAPLGIFGSPGEHYLAQSSQPGEILLRKIPEKNDGFGKAWIVEIGAEKFLTNGVAMTNADVQKVLSDFP
jgi:hypothetical protein